MCLQRCKLKPTVVYLGGESTDIANNASDTINFDLTDNFRLLSPHVSKRMKADEPRVTVSRGGARRY